MNLYPLLSQLMQFLKFLKNSIIGGADKIEKKCIIDVTLQRSRGITVCSPPLWTVSSAKSIKAIYQSFKNSIIDGADNIESLFSIDVTPWISSIDVTPHLSRGITVYSPPVWTCIIYFNFKAIEQSFKKINYRWRW